MAGGAKIVVGADISEVKPALDSVARSVVQTEKVVGGAFQGWVGNANAVATATEKLERDLKSFASEQRTQGRMARFYAGEIASIIPAADDAKIAIQGLAGVAIEGLAGGLSFGLAFEAMKLAIEGVSSVMKSHEERVKAVESAHIAAASAIMAGKYALEDLKRGALSEGERAFKRVFDAATEGVKDFQKEAEKLRPTTWQLVKAFIWDGSLGMQRLQEQSAKAAGELERIVASAKQLAEEARRIAELPVFGPGNDFGAATFEVQKSASDKAVEKAKELDAAWQKVIADLDQANRKLIQHATLAEQAYGLGEVPGIGIGLTPQEARDFTNRRGPVFGPGNDQGAAEFAINLEKVNAESSQMKELWTSIGGSVSSAFSAIGNAVGGIAGKVLAWLGQMITQAISLAIALSAAGSAWTTPLGSLAIAGTVAAGLLALVSSISARADGGPIDAYRPYLVGERGPELVVPGNSGTVIPNHMLGGGTNITIHATDADSFERMLRRHDNALVRVLRDASRAGRA